MVAVRDPDAPTGLMIKEHRGGRPWRVRYYRAGSAASAVVAADVDAVADEIGAADVAAPHRHHRRARRRAALAAVERAIEVARAAGTLVSFDVNHRAHAVARPTGRAPVLARLAAAADLVFAGPEEAALVLGRTPGPCVVRRGRAAGAGAGQARARRRSWSSSVRSARSRCPATRSTGRPARPVDGGRPGRRRRRLRRGLPREVVAGGAGRRATAHCEPGRRRRVRARGDWEGYPTATRWRACATRWIRRPAGSPTGPTGGACDDRDNSSDPLPGRPVVVLDDPDQPSRSVRRCSRAAIDVVEVTLRTDARPRADPPRWPELPGLHVGAGSVLVPDAGRPGRRRRCAVRGEPRAVGRGAAARPGARGGRPARGGDRVRADAAVVRWAWTEVKFFPAGLLGGPAAIRALSPRPFTRMSFMPSGGVRADNMARLPRRPGRARRERQLDGRPGAAARGRVGRGHGAFGGCGGAGDLRSPSSGSSVG